MENDSIPLFSVIVPLYNKERYVERTLRGVLSQQVRDFELILVDDGSTDRGAKKARSVQDPRIKVLGQKNAGVAAARNRGMSLASGEWLAFLDADDLWGGEHLAELRRLINAFPEAGMVGTCSREVSEGGNIEFLDNASPGELRKINYFEEASADIGVIHSSNTAIKRRVFDAIGGFADYQYGEDLEYWARVALNFPVVKSSRPTVVYYRGNGGLMENMMHDRPSDDALPAALSDVSPSVGLLASRLDGIASQSKLRRSVIGYVNSRLSQGMRSAFIRGDISTVKALRALCFRPLAAWKHRRWWLIGGMPSGVLTLASYTRNRAKRAYLRIKG